MSRYGSIYAGIGLLAALGAQGCDDPECPAGTVRLGTRCAPNVRADGGAGDGTGGDGGEEQDARTDAAPRGDAAQGDGDTGPKDAGGGDDGGPNACSPNPCQNDGVCSLGEEGAQCDCVSGHGGERCELDPCETSPCLHETACVRVAGAAQCDCGASGYEGALCETDIDECATASCAEAYPCMQTAPPGFTCRGQFADWPMPDSSPGAKVAPAYDTQYGSWVVDRVTGLSWQRTLPGTAGGGSSYAGCVNEMGVAQTRCTWAQAKAYCEGLLLGERSDWRLPTRIELESIVDFGRQSPSIPDAFPNTQAGLFWSSSPAAGTADVAWYVAFLHGISSVAPTTTPAFVRCVRGTPLPLGVHYAIGDEAGEGEVSDLRTSLVWQRSAAGPRGWTEARSYCQQRGAGWRLPTIKELLTLVDPARPLDGTPLLNVDVFPNAEATGSWSSSTYLAGGDYRWYVDFSTGASSAADPTAEHTVRCVR